ncbi:Solute carrier family 2, facilitated glucose transporter member 1 [Hypsibius exemplaris]|uniref:Solute carrier family 2, facilitated glucose transporter member 1 n=1 Tax=Hypsibius exemplaris TaxID=2072580 RepID=A0A9X6RJF1_HYPEX|nr:Solute carrier family 2, facilitated glucose transporter member 1 [Hypsibius exemplaris]
MKLQPHPTEPRYTSVLINNEVVPRVPLFSSMSSKPTAWLAFSVFSAVFGSSFLFGYNIGVLNAPQNIIGLWIRRTRCMGKGGIPDSEEGMSKHLWCEKLNKQGETNMFADNGELNTLWALINAFIPGGAILGALASSFLVGRFGPKMSLILNNVLAVTAAILTSLSMTAGSVEMLIIGRFFAGVNSGISAGVTPTYLNEISPPNLRGAIGSTHPLSIMTAIWISQIFGLPFVLGTSERWPILLALAAIPALFQLVTLPLCPDSPKYLYFSRQDREGAQNAIRKFQGNAKILTEMTLMEEEYNHVKDKPKVTIGDLLSDPFLRRTLFIMLALMVFQMFSGLDAVMFYSTAIFRSAGLVGDTALYATIGVGAVNVTMTTIALFLVEKVGRRVLLLIGFSGIILFLILLTISLCLFKSGDPGPEFPNAANTYAGAAYASMVSIFGFIIMFASGPNSIPWILMSEYFVQGPRAAAAGLIAGANRFSSLVVTLSFPYLQAAIGEYCFIIFGVLNVMAVAFIAIYIVETKGKSTDQIQRDLRNKMRSQPISEKRLKISSS